MLSTTTIDQACLPENTQVVKSLMENNLLESIQINSVLTVLLQALATREQDAPILNTVTLLTEVLERVIMRNKQLIKITHNEDTPFSLLSPPITEQDSNRTIGIRIQGIRKARGITQKDIAELVGVTPSCVTQWESDLISPSCDKLITLAKALGCEPLWLIGK